MAVQQVELIKGSLINVLRFPGLDTDEANNTPERIVASVDTVPLTARRDASEDDVLHHLSSALNTEITGVLTTHALITAQNCLKDLHFDDVDLQDYGALNERKDRIRKTAFGKIEQKKSEVQNEREHSAYKRRPLLMAN